MGFSFDRAGAAGGKIVRKGLSLAAAGAQLSYVAATQGPTYPTWDLNNARNLTSVFGAVWTKGSGTASASVSIGSTYWVDMMIVMASGTNPMTQVNINGASFSMRRQFNTGAGLIFPFDVYGYGLSMTAYAAGAMGFIYVLPVVPNTVINSQGVVQFPPGLSGRSVYRDGPAP